MAAEKQGYGNVVIQCLIRSVFAHFIFLTQGIISDFCNGCTDICYKIHSVGSLLAETNAV